MILMRALAVWCTGGLRRDPVSGADSGATHQAPSVLKRMCSSPKIVANFRSLVSEHNLWHDRDRRKINFNLFERDDLLETFRMRVYFERFS